MIKICNDRSVFPNSVKISNQYENDTRSIDFDLSEVQFKGNVYLICKYQGQSTFYAPLLLDENNSIPVETFLSAQPGAYTCVIVISTVTIDADYNFSSDNPLFVSNEFTLNVDPNFLTGTATAWQLTPAAQNYFDQLIALVDKVQEDLDNGSFVGNGIKSITLISTVGLVDTYQILFTDNSTFDFQVTNGATPTITIQDGVWFVNGISTGVSALGQKGDKGDPGVGIVSIEKTSTSGNIDTYTITFTNQTTSTFTVTNGTNGKDGVTPNIQIGTVSTLPAGSQATASITGTTENPILNLGIPEGETGGTTNYNDLENKPSINGVELSGNQSGNNVGLVDAQQGIENSGKVLGIGQDGLVVPVENAGASDNIIYKDVAKQLNPNITDSFQRAMWNLKLYGQSTQVTTTGKNLFDIDGNVNTTVNNTQGAKNSVQNGILTSNYNSSNEALGGQLIKIENGKQYTISLNVISIGTGSGAYIAIYRNGEPIYSPNTKVGAWKTTITATVDEILLAFGTNGGVGAKYTNIQVEEGASQTSYEPYSGGQPSPNPQYPQEITAISQFEGNIRNSFQLLDKTQFKPSVVSGVTLTVDDNGIKLSGTATVSTGFTHSFDNAYFKKIFKSGNIYVRKNTSLNVLFTLYIRNGTELLGYANDTIPFNITEEIFQNPNTRGEFYIFISSGVTVDGYINPMVYQDGDGTWEPFDSNPQEVLYTPTNPMYSTQDSSIADYVDVEKGVEVYNMSGAVVFDGNENWSKSGMNYGDYVGFYLNGYIARSLVMCNKLPYYNFENNEAIKEAIYIFGDGSLKILILKSRLTEISANGFKTWLSQNPITVVYPLVSPTETPIPQEQLSMLRALYTYTGVTNFLCNAPVSFTYERSLQIVINNLENAIGQTNANILLGGTL